MFKKFISSCLKGDVDSVIRYADHVLPYVISDGFNYAITNGHLPVVQWIHETEQNAIHAIQYHQGFGLACENGHIHIAKWILEVNPNVNTTIDILIAFNKSCQKNQIGVVEWLFRMNSATINHFLQNHNILVTFEMCAMRGYLRMMQWLFDKNPNIDVSQNHDTIFVLACTSNHLNIAQWLLEIQPTINISAQDERALTWACHHGYLSVVQFLLDRNPQNVSTQDEKPFRWACEKGHFEIARLLLKHKPTIDIHAVDHYAFRKACANQHGIIVQWLCDINPYLFDITYKKNGKVSYYHIRPIQDARWLRRRYAVWLAHKKSPNKTSILYQLPEDVSRYCALFL